jgi:hypothetical protein
MSTTRRAPKRPAGIDFESDEYTITNSFGRCSGEEAAPVAGSAVADSDACSDVTASEESDSATEEEGKRA